MNIEKLNESAIYINVEHLPNPAIGEVFGCFVVFLLLLLEIYGEGFDWYIIYF